MIRTRHNNLNLVCLPSFLCVVRDNDATTLSMTIKNGTLNIQFCFPGANVIKPFWP
jgi:hypothetical protein